MASRSQLANSIREASIGDSIMADIEASIQSSSSASTGKGAVTASRYLADTSDKVANMKSRALGARTDAGLTPKEDNFVVDKLSGVARDWMTSMLGDDDETKPVIAERRSEIMSQEAMAPLDENTSVDEKFLRTGKLPPVTKKATPDDINSAVQEAIEYDGETTSSAGLMSRKTAPRPFTALEIEQAAEMGVTISNKNGLPADENGDIVKANAFTDFFKNLFGSKESGDIKTDMMVQLKKHEGYKAYPYKDTEGKWTIGIGHLIGDGSTKGSYAQYSKSNPMTDADVQDLFNEDYEEHVNIAKGYPAFDKLNDSGRKALIDLTFNMGDLTRGWPNTLAMLNSGDFEGAAKAIEGSKYAKQVGNRAKTIAKQIRNAKIIKSDVEA
jgi:lysozyme